MKILFATLWSILMLGTPAIACSCVFMPQPCDRSWSYGDFVFYGVVSSEVPLTNGPASPYDAHFTSTEVFRGPRKDGDEISVRTTGGRGDCGYPFEIGKAYLVYALKTETGYSASKCSLTAPASSHSARLRELRARRDGKPLSDLFGTVGVRLNTWSLDIKPLEGIPIHAIDGDRTYGTRTDEFGDYRFDHLPAGKYKVEAQLPKSVRNPGPLPTLGFAEILPGRVVVPGCEISIGVWDSR